MLRIRVLGSAAGGGFPQWNCGCRVCREAWAGNPKAKPRSQSSIGVTADGERWLLLNASPDIKTQILASPALHPRGEGRHSPIAAVFLTNGDVDHVAGLLSLREGHRFDLFATRTVIDIIETNPIFGVLSAAAVTRRPIPLDRPVDIGIGLSATAFAVPGKVPLYLEGDEVAVGEESESVVGVEIGDGTSRFIFVPGCAVVTPALRSRIKDVPLLFFDGTTFTDDEMTAAGLGWKTAARMGHVAMTGANGSIPAFSGTPIGRRVFIHINNTNPVLIDDSPERAEVAAAGWDIACDGMEIVL